MDVEGPCRSATFFERIAPTRWRPEEASPCRGCTARIAESLELHMKRRVPVESASALIDERIKELGDWRGKTLAKVRQIIHEADPEIVEEWKWRGVPVWSHDGFICTGEVYKNHVKMTFPIQASSTPASRATPGAPSTSMKATRSMRRL
jgi:hypothetical protein